MKKLPDTIDCVFGTAILDEFGEPRPCSKSLKDIIMQKENEKENNYNGRLGKADKIAFDVTQNLANTETLSLY